MRDSGIVSIKPLAMPAAKIAPVAIVVTAALAGYLAAPVVANYAKFSRPPAAPIVRRDIPAATPRPVVTPSPAPVPHATTIAPPPAPVAASTPTPTDAAGSDVIARFKKTALEGLESQGVPPDLAKAEVDAFVNASLSMLHPASTNPAPPAPVVAPAQRTAPEPSVIVVRSLPTPAEPKATVAPQPVERVVPAPVRTPPVVAPAQRAAPR
jgi:hypothetical protein